MPSASERNLVMANDVRRYQRDLRKEVRELRKEQSWERLADELDDPDPRVENLAVSDLLAWGRGMGPSWLERVLGAALVPSYKRIKSLTEEERCNLADTLRRMASTPERKPPRSIGSPEIDKAVTRRQQRASLKRSLAFGDITLIDVIQRKPECCWEMPTYELVQSLPGIGSARLQALNAEALSNGVNLFTPFLELTPRARGWLVKRFS